MEIVTLNVAGFEEAMKANNIDEIISAIIHFTGKGWRKTKNNRYEAYSSEKYKTINLGTYNSKKEAEQIILNYKINRLIENLRENNIDIKDAHVVKDKYLAFPSGIITNLTGYIMIGCINKHGYREYILNGKNVFGHRIIAEAFIPKVKGKNCINHKNGIKIDNRVENLEWCTHSENTMHAYKNELEKKVTGINHHAHVLSLDALKDIRNNVKLHSKTNSYVAFAKKYGVSRDTIRRAYKGVSYYEN